MRGDGGVAEIALQVDGLGHAYREGPWLFRSLGFSLPAGSSLAILAPNGRGKSTLLAALGGTLLAREGQVVRPLSVASVPTGLAVEFDYTVFDIVLMGRARHVALFSPPALEDERQAREALHRFGLHHMADRPFASLSTGERQLALLARAVASEARLLLLDEPTASLDLHRQQDVVRWIDQLVAEKFTIVYTTHDPNLGAVAENALLLFGDREHLFGTSRSVITEAALSRLYGCRIVSATAADPEFASDPFFVLPLRS